MYLRGDVEGGGKNEGAGRMRLERRKRRNISVVFGQQGLIPRKHPGKHMNILKRMSLRIVYNSLQAGVFIY